MGRNSMHAASSTQSQGQGAQGAGQLNILIAEDDEPILTALTQGIESSGYRVTGTASGEEAIELGLAAHFDLGIFDVQRHKKRTIPFLHPYTFCPD